MSPVPSRREFLAQLAATGAVPWSVALTHVPPVAAAEATPSAGIATFRRDVEPLVQLLEKTPREKVLEAVGQRIRRGESYQRVLAAVMLAAVRNVQPYPAVGFKFHSVLVINSCHLASLAGPDEDRWLPLFWAIDYFKVAQAEEAQSTGWRLPASPSPAAVSIEAAQQEFVAAMDAWDVERADVATVKLLLAAPAGLVFEQFANYAARDFRSIGHKAIYLANAWRTLQVIGWEFAEPIFRSLTLALLNHRGDPNPAQNDLAPDRSWKESAALVSRLTPEWQLGQKSWNSSDVLSWIRQPTASEVMTTAVTALQQGVAVQNLWDGIFLGAGELLMQQPGIVALHSLTTANALHFLWKQTGDDTLRQRILLQAASFNAQFRTAAAARGSLLPRRIDQIAPEVVPSDPAAAVAAILTEISADPVRAAAKVRHFLEAGGDEQLLLDGARRLTFQKGRDAHDYKFSSAILEDAAKVSPDYRPWYLAAAVFRLKGSGDRESGLLKRTQAALG